MFPVPSPHPTCPSADGLEKTPSQTTLSDFWGLRSPESKGPHRSPRLGPMVRFESDLKSDPLEGVDGYSYLPSNTGAQAGKSGGSHPGAQQKMWDTPSPGRRGASFQLPHSPSM